MNKDLSELLRSIYEFGQEHDSVNKTHSEQMLNITPDTGEFLSILIQAVKATKVLEVGTSNGYSTIWMADALRNTGGCVTTLEISQDKTEMAKSNFVSSGLSEFIDLQLGDIRTFLKSQIDESFDFIFLDAERPQYSSYWRDIDRVLKKRCLLVVDNALSPKPEELEDFFKLVKDSNRYLIQTIQVGKGETIALKQR